MSECPHEHRVCETHLRSILKGITAKIAEISFDFVILYVLGVGAGESLAVAIGLESICYGLGYINERGWNKIMWGRRVVDVIISQTNTTH
jgi:hypothetical protein